MIDLPDQPPSGKQYFFWCILLPILMLLGGGVLVAMRLSVQPDYGAEMVLLTQEPTSTPIPQPTLAPPSIAEQELLEGDTAFYAKDYDTAILHYKYAIDSDPKMAVAYYNLGSTYVALEDYEIALIYYDVAITLEPYRTDYRRNRGLVYYYLQDYNSVISTYCYLKDNRMIPTTTGVPEELEDDFQTKRDQSQHLFEMQDYEQARLYAEAMIELAPNAPIGYYALGYMQLKLEDYWGALESFGKAIELDPDNIHWYWYRGLAYHRLKDYNASRDDLNKAMELAPDNEAIFTEAEYQQSTRYSSNLIYTFLTVQFKSTLITLIPNMNYAELAGDDTDTVI